MSDTTTPDDDITLAQNKNLLQQLFNPMDFNTADGEKFSDTLDDLVEGDNPGYPRLFPTTPPEWEFIRSQAKTVPAGSHRNAKTNLTWSVYYQTMFLLALSEKQKVVRAANTTISQLREQITSLKEENQGLKEDTNRDIELANSQLFITRVQKVILTPEKARSMLFLFGFPSMKVCTPISHRFL